MKNSRNFLIQIRSQSVKKSFTKSDIKLNSRNKNPEKRLKKFN